MPDRESPFVTSSEVANWKRCKRKWWLRNYRQLRTPDGAYSPVNIGNLVHRALEEYYDPQKGGDPVHAIFLRAKRMIEENAEFASQIAHDAEYAGIMVEGYMEWLKETGADDGLRFISAEEKVEAPLGKTGFILRGKIDARAEREFDGARVQVEHKTVQNLTDLPKLAQINPQFLTYHLLEFLDALNKGETSRSDGMLLNMLRRVKRTARANPPFYARHEVRFNIDEIRNHWLHVVEAAKQMDEARIRLNEGADHHKVVPPTPDKDCAWKCDFYLICPLFDDGSRVEDMIAQNYEEHGHMERYEEEDDE